MQNIENLIEQSKQLKLLYVEDNADSREAILCTLEDFLDDIIVAING